ncbi:MAG: polysaccharide deacetylase family protein [Oscillospiraceae bacterium]|nr:polysaccharide deacetylase family protein [Oscillospiraceae bacterium]
MQANRRKLCLLLLPILVVLLLAVGAVFNLWVNQWGPRIFLKGNREVILECGSTYLDAGAEAVYGGRWLMPNRMELPVTITGEVNPAVPGDYTINYLAESSRHGRLHTANSTRLVHVVDTTPPVLLLLENPDIYTLPGQEYQEEGYTAEDIADGNLTDRVLKREEKGIVYYEVTDSSGNQTKAQRTIVYKDPIPPELTLLGDTELSMTAGKNFEEPGFLATDNVDGDITDRVKVSGQVDKYHKGTYTLTYTVSDTYGNTVTAERQIEVLPIRQPDSVSPGNKVVYLTFDDGPGRYTAQLLDVLAEHNVKATFFVVNTGYESLIAREVKEGHSVGIHSATHDYSTIYASEDAYFSDLNKMAGIIYNASGQTTTLLRFPGGSSNTVSNFNPGIMTRLADAVTTLGYQYFDWNVTSGDAGETTDTDRVVENVIKGIQSHNVSIVLQHDIKGFSVDAVDEIITWGLANGYTFLPLTPGSPTAHHGINN